MTPDEARRLALEAATIALREAYEKGELPSVMAAAAVTAHDRALWQPIETAPRDGTFVQVYACVADPSRWSEEMRDLTAFQCVIGYDPAGGWCVCEIREATHWRPLPARPGEG